MKASKMQKAGLEKVEAAKWNRNWDIIVQPPAIETTVVKDFQKALDENPFLFKSY